MARSKGGKTSTVPFSPHLHSPKSLYNVMWDVVIALLPATFASVWFFGINSVRIIGISVVTAVLTELVACLLMKRDITVLDGSAVITGLLFAFNLPPSAPWYVVVIGSMFSIGIVKMAFGGLGYNIMNPALGGRIFVLAAWSTAMVNRWSPTIQGLMKQGDSFAVASAKIVNAAPAQIVTNTSSVTNQFTGVVEQVSTVSTNVLDMISSASPLNSLKAVYETVGQSITNITTNGVTNIIDATTMASHNVQHVKGTFSYWNMFVGNIPGCIGETSALALLIGFIYLLVRKVIMPTIPVIYIGVVAFLSWMLGGLPLGMGWFAGDALYHILGGGLFLGAIFMATDYVTSPMTVKGQVLFAVCLGLLTVIIRLWGGYPEGVSYSIVLMNIFVPIIDRYIKPKIYGYSRKKAGSEEGAK